MEKNLREKHSKALVLIHNFPRFPTDISGIGFQPLFTKLAAHVDLDFLVPHDRGLKEEDIFNNLRVHRFRYGREDNEVLAYRGNMHLRALKKPLTTWRFLQAFRCKAIQLAGRLAPDVLWAHWWIPAGWVGYKARFTYPIPLVITCHGTDIFLLNRFRWLRPLARRVFSTADRITVVSHFLKRQLIDAIGVQGNELEDKIIIAPLPVKREAFYYDPDIERAPNTIISASRFTKQKHVDLLLRAVARLTNEGISCQLDLYGDGPERQTLNNLIRQLSLQQQVHLHSPLTQVDLAERYRRSAIAVLASEHEGFGLMLVEAMLCGCVAVGARSGGITDIISEDGTDGLLIEPGSVDSLYRALKMLLTDEQLRRRLAAAGCESAAKRFSDQQIISQFRQLISPKGKIIY
ncbi:MAG: glycosyltransferase [candidate division Zixibacteria bacterium]|nr:glycosyltransferase [candidate division Zixibacteria bacterium]